MKRLLGDIRRADERFGLIAPGTCVAVGLSGGKDSLALLHALHEYRHIKDFSLIALTVVPKGRMYPAPLVRLCGSLHIPYEMKESNLFDTLFQAEQKNPCALCARIRRGTLIQMAKEHGADTLCLGHHLDDAIETLLMALIYEGRFHTLTPKAFMSREQVTLIRPLILTREKDLAALCSRMGWASVKNPCPVDGHTVRAEMKDLLQKAEEKYPDLAQQLAHAMLDKDFFQHIPEEICQNNFRP